MKNIFDKTSINKLELKNRIMRSAAWMNAADESGFINESLIKIYEDLAKGGIGLINTGYAYILKEDKPNPNMIGIYDDKFIPKLKELTDTVHKHNAKIGLQIVYGSSTSTHPNAAEMDLIGPSAVKNNMTGITPKEASIEDFRHIVKAFGDAAERAKKAGFDAVQFHAAHGYFITLLLSPYFNRREDEYGGDIHSRAKLLYEIVAEVRNRVGKDFPVMIKINYDDLMGDKGIQFHESMEVFKRLDNLGIAMIELSAGNLAANPEIPAIRTKLSKIESQSYYKEAATELAKHVNAKVAFVGGNRTPSLFNEIINNSDIELISIARPFIAEPYLVNKWKENIDYKAKCVSCNRCWDTVPVSCILNRKK
ncbi:MAG: NADH:flavin oxidoreductase [Marinifilaceae bacterium]|jgi:2,4-dienoyl-CoA reductase-like NADH-dependent reductase (Old Yellow Enzyme family)|nr:NADH:flavin oxidoreductase [Marinifilaceae bacterium]